MNSKDKGNIGEAIVLAEFVKKGIQISIPFGDNARYDLIADFNGKLNRIQIKYCNQKIEYDGIHCPCASSTNHTTNKHYTTYNNDVDYICFYLVEWDKTLILSMEEIGTRKTITFRLTKPKNGQANVNYANDYLLEDFLNELNR